MFDFETIHKNHKWAFIDGALCGIVLAWIGKLWYDAWRLDTPPVAPQETPQSPNNVYHLAEPAGQR